MARCNLKNKKGCREAMEEMTGMGQSTVPKAIQQEMIDARASHGGRLFAVISTPTRPR